MPTVTKSKARPSPKKNPKSGSETVIAFILDKSGSMSSVQNATISGFNEYIKNLKGDGNKYRLTLTLFDTEVKIAQENEAIEDVWDLDEKSYAPDGMTALYDAVYQTITRTEKGLKKDQKVLCVIMTDGAENSSREYSEKQVFAKIKELEKNGNWSFVFLGANQDSWIMGQKFGLSQANVANYQNTAQGVNQVFVTMSANTRAFGGGGGAKTSNFFSQKDKDDLENTK